MPGVLASSSCGRQQLDRLLQGRHLFHDGDGIVAVDAAASFVAGPAHDGFALHVTGQKLPHVADRTARWCDQYASVELQVGAVTSASSFVVSILVWERL